jgi:hypothetical protein
LTSYCDEKTNDVGGLLTINDGTHFASIAMSGAYDPAKFGLLSDATGHALVTYDWHV